MLPGKEIFLLFIGSFLLQLARANTKHMYALCPPDFFGIGTECYYISQNKVNWLDAHFDCKDRKSRLAEPNKYEDRMLRKFLVNNDITGERKWIGGNYNWAQKKWQWQDGKEFVYQSFSQMPGGTQELHYHCAILNPNLKYRWSASSCVDKHQYICQHRMPYVNEKHRSRIYTRWNQTYPNERATEVEVVLNDADMLKRGHRQSIPKNGRSTNTQRLSRHRNYLANEWLKKYRTQQIIVRRNQVSNEITYINTQDKNASQRPSRLPPRRRNPSIGRELGRDDFIQFERRKNVNRGALITNKVDDFEKREPVTVPPTAGSYDVPFSHSNREVEVTSAPIHQSREQDVTSAPRQQGRDEGVISNPRRRNRVQNGTSAPRRSKVNNEIDLKEKKRLDETRQLLETGRYEHAYTRRRTSSTTTARTTTTTNDATTTEANVVEDNNEIESERDRELEHRRRLEEEAQQRREQEERIRRRQEQEAEERRRHEEEVEEIRRQEEEAEERRRHEERLQNQIDEETLRIQREEELRRLRHQEDEQKMAEERQRIHDDNVREREEKMRMRELELKQREEDEQKIREDEERRQEENRQRLEDIERQQREDEEKQRKEAENKRIDEENKRRRKEELRNKQKIRERENQVSQNNEEDQLTDIREDSRLKEKLRREKLAKLKERIKNLSPEDQLKFFELRGQRSKKQSDGNETATNQL